MWEPLLLMLISNVYAYPAFVSVQIYCEIGLWDPPLKDTVLGRLVDTVWDRKIYKSFHEQLSSPYVHIPLDLSIKL